MVTLQDYEGREQTYVKHTFLQHYLEALVHKTASRYHHIAYVDGFAGPWQSVNESFEDTSFGIALGVLRAAKASWKSLSGREVVMSAFLVERNQAAYERLADVLIRYPDITVKTYHDDFLSSQKAILNEIPLDAFTFFLIDPKGWRISLRALQPLLSRSKSEVIFNFMFDFINRAANISDPTLAASLDDLIPYGNFRARLAEAEKASSTGLNPEERKAILVDAFRESLARLGMYVYIAETTVLRPIANRPHYCLIYATRHPKGIEAFRDSQIKTLKVQSRTRAATKIKHKEGSSGQGEMFRSLHDMGPDELNNFLTAELLAAERSLLALSPVKPDAILYNDLWPQILAQHAVRRPDVNRIAARLRSEGGLLFPDWEYGRHVPQPNYRVQRG